MILKIGNLDMIPYVARGGIKWQRSDIEGENAGHMLNGTMRRDRIAVKIRLDVTCRPPYRCGTGPDLICNRAGVCNFDLYRPCDQQHEKRTILQQQFPVHFRYGAER